MPRPSAIAQMANLPGSGCWAIYSSVLLDFTCLYLTEKAHALQKNGLLGKPVRGQAHPLRQ